MILTDELLNYPTPILVIDKESGLVAEKNYCANIAIDVLHIGAKASRYTSDIDFNIEKLAIGTFCDKKCTYFTIARDKFTLLFLSFSTFGETLLPFDVFELYKSRINSLTSKDNIKKNSDRKYVREINNNLLKVNYFRLFSELFEAKLNNKTIKINEKTTSITKICTAIKMATTNYLENVSINFDIDYYDGVLTAEIFENDFISLILNSLMFCIINSLEDINVKLVYIDHRAKLSFSFKSSNTFNKLFDPDNDVLNSSFALMVAAELAKTYNINFGLTKEVSNRSSIFTLSYDIPVSHSNRLDFSSENTVIQKTARLLLNIFFDEEI